MKTEAGSANSKEIYFDDPVTDIPEIITRAHETRGARIYKAWAEKSDRQFRLSNRLGIYSAIESSLIQLHVAHKTVRQSLTQRFHLRQNVAHIRCRQYPFDERSQKTVMSLMGLIEETQELLGNKNRALLLERAVNDLTESIFFPQYLKNLPFKFNPSKEVLNQWEGEWKIELEGKS